MVRIVFMRPDNTSDAESDPPAAAGFSQPTRRDIVRYGGAVLAAGLFGEGWMLPSAMAQSQGQPETLDLQAGKLALRNGAPESLAILYQPAFAGSFTLGEAIQLRSRNGLSAPIAITLLGNGGPVVTPSLAEFRADDTIRIATRHSGTMLAEFALSHMRDPLCVAALVVQESSPSTADRDEIMLIEEWRVRADGKLSLAGTNEGDSSRIFTLNRKLTSDFNIRRHERLRLRFINASQRSVIAVRIENHDLRVIAADSRPAEPYPALNGQVALAPGSRVDVLLDVNGDTGSTSNLLLHDGTAPHTLARFVYASDEMRNAPLPEAPPLVDANPPTRPDLRNAQRVELAFDGKSDARGWSGQPLGALAPAFTAKRGRTVSLAIVNKTAAPAIFRIVGIHARLLDRLDDGWKPYWVDTMAVATGQTTRIAFVPSEAGLYFIESFAPEWSAPLLVRSFAVE